MIDDLFAGRKLSLNDMFNTMEQLKEQFDNMIGLTVIDDRREKVTSIKNKNIPPELEMFKGSIVILGEGTYEELFKKYFGLIERKEQTQQQAALLEILAGDYRSTKIIINPSTVVEYWDKFLEER